VSSALAAALLMLPQIVERELKRPRVVVSARPQVVQAPGSVHAIARVHDPAQELHCPTFTWEWGDDTISAWEPNCDPYEQPEDRRTLWTLWTTKPHVYRRPGSYDLALKVTAGDRTLRASVRVTVVGPAMFAEGGTR
jgi:hypothetical protein